MSALERKATALELVLVQHSLRHEQLESENEWLRDQLESHIVEREMLRTRLSPREIRGQLQQIATCVLAGLSQCQAGNLEATGACLFDALNELQELTSTISSPSST